MAVAGKTNKPSRRERENEARHNAIIEVAVELFAAGGYFGTRIEEIAERAEFSRSAVYLHFPGGKDELYAAAMIMAVRARTEMVAESIAVNSGEGQSRLRTVWRALELFNEQHPNYVRLLGSLGFNDIRNVLQTQTLTSIKSEGTKTFQLVDRVLRSDYADADELRRLPKLHLAWAVWGSFLGTVQFAEALAHVGHQVDMHSLLSSTLAMLEPQFVQHDAS